MFVIAICWTVGGIRARCWRCIRPWIVREEVGCNWGWGDVTGGRRCIYQR